MAEFSAQVLASGGLFRWSGGPVLPVVGADEAVPCGQVAMAFRVWKESFVLITPRLMASVGDRCRAARSL